MFETLFLLLVGHAVADFALQSDWMVRYKSRHNTEAAVLSRRPDMIWLHVLSAHSLIHGGAVYLVTGVIWLGLAETAAHWLIDYGKGEDWFGFHTDQFLHILCKLAWLAFLI